MRRTTNICVIFLIINNYTGLSAYNPEFSIKIKQSSHDSNSKPAAYVDEYFAKHINAGLIKGTVQNEASMDSEDLQVSLQSDYFESELTISLSNEATDEHVREQITGLINTFSNRLLDEARSTSAINDGWKSLYEKVKSSMLVFDASNSEADSILYFNPEGSSENWRSLLNLDVASRQLDTLKFGYIDCHLHQSKCEFTKDLPVLRVFKENKVIGAFDSNELSSIDHNTLHQWLAWSKMPSVGVLDEDIVPLYRNGMIPGVGGVASTVHMLFIDTKRNRVYKDFKKVAREFHGRFPFAALVHKDVAKWANNPAIITSKPLEPDGGLVYTLYKNLSIEAIKSYVEVTAHPAVCDLTSLPSFFACISRRLPVLILLDPTMSLQVSHFISLASKLEGLERRMNTNRYAKINGTNLISSILLEMMHIEDRHQPQWIIITPAETDEKKFTIRTTPYALLSEEGLRTLIDDAHKLPAREINLDLDLLENLKQLLSIRDMSIIYDTQIIAQEPSPLSIPATTEDVHTEL